MIKMKEKEKKKFISFKKPTRSEIVTVLCVIFLTLVILYNANHTSLMMINDVQRNIFRNHEFVDMVVDDCSGSENELLCVSNHFKNLEYRNVRNFITLDEFIEHGGDCKHYTALASLIFNRMGYRTSIVEVTEHITLIVEEINHNWYCIFEQGEYICI